MTLLVGDGARGLPEEAPFDAINVAAAATAVPPALEEQLVAGGKLVVPVNDARLYVVERTRAGSSAGRWSACASSRWSPSGTAARCPRR